MSDICKNSVTIKYYFFRFTAPRAEFTPKCSWYDLPILKIGSQICSHRFRSNMLHSMQGNAELHFIHYLQGQPLYFVCAWSPLHC